MRFDICLEKDLVTLQFNAFFNNQSGGYEDKTILRKVTHPKQKSSLIRRKTRLDFKKIGFGSFPPQRESFQSYSLSFKSKVSSGHLVTHWFKITLSTYPILVGFRQLSLTMKSKN